MNLNISNLTIELETVCPSCKGKGGETERRQWYPCVRCEGAGYIPTEIGASILALVRHNFGPLVAQSNATRCDRA
jgi:DnaJ-class molecular chaperone